MKGGKISLLLSLCLGFILALLSSCRCFPLNSGEENGKGDGGSTVFDGRQGSYRTEIIFISPRPGELVSGQIEVEVEVRDLDGIREV